VRAQRIAVAVFRRGATKRTPTPKADWAQWWEYERVTLLRCKAVLEEFGTRGTTLMQALRGDYEILKSRVDHADERQRWRNCVRYMRENPL